MGDKVMRSPPPRGKMLLIGSEAVEVYPHYCGDGHRCIQCFFNGKYLCAPRYWLYPTLNECDGYPVSTKAALWRANKFEISLLVEGRFGDALRARLAGQPLVPMPDGGFVAEMTDRVMSEPYNRRRNPERITDVPCGKCGYPCLDFFRRGSPHNNYRDRYKCPQCGTQQVKDTQRIVPIDIVLVKPLLRELRESGVSVEASRKLIRQKLGVQISRNTYGRLIKEMGLPPRKFEAPREVCRQNVLKSRNHRIKALREAMAVE